MSPEATSTSAATDPTQSEPSPSWPVLSVIERRILGVLIEKQKTSKTADSYPLTLNSLVTGCNQKSNREPVLDLDEIEVEEGLTALQKKGLVERITGGRAERFKHKLYESWTKNGPELAVLAELLLRGPQTKGDLRGRAGRMDAIDTLDALDAILRPLAARHLVVYLGDPDRRGALVSHGFHLPDELTGLKSHAPAVAPVPSRSGSPDSAVGLEAKLAFALAEIENLKVRMTALESALSDLRNGQGLSAANA